MRALRSRRLPLALRSARGSAAALGAGQLAAGALPGVGRTRTARSSRRAAAPQCNPRRRTRLHPPDRFPHPPPATQWRRASIPPRPAPGRGQPLRPPAQIPPACSASPNRRPLLLRRLHHSQTTAAHVAIMHMIISVHAAYGLDNSNLRANSPKPNFLISAPCRAVATPSRACRAEATRRRVSVRCWMLDVRVRFQHFSLSACQRFPLRPFVPFLPSAFCLLPALRPPSSVLRPSTGTTNYRTMLWVTPALRPVASPLDKP